MSSLFTFVEIAEHMIERFGEEALAILADRVREHYRCSEADGAHMWRRVEQAARELLRLKGSDAPAG